MFRIYQKAHWILSIIGLIFLINKQMLCMPKIFFFKNLKRL